MLRYLAKNEEIDSNGNTDDKVMLLQLQKEEQLELGDIVRALKDTTLNTSALYNASNSVLSDNATQLYFGPGFEDRLELELDK